MESVHSLFVLLAFRPRELIFFFPPLKLSSELLSHHGGTFWKPTNLCLSVLPLDRTLEEPCSEAFLRLISTYQIHLSLNQEGLGMV